MNKNLLLLFNVLHELNVQFTASQLTTSHILNTSNATVTAAHATTDTTGLNATTQSSTFSEAVAVDVRYFVLLAVIPLHLIAPVVIGAVWVAIGIWLERRDPERIRPEDPDYWLKIIASTTQAKQDDGEQEPDDEPSPGPKVGKATDTDLYGELKKIVERGRSARAATDQSQGQGQGQPDSATQVMRRSPTSRSGAAQGSPHTGTPSQAEGDNLAALSTFATESLKSPTKFEDF